tara:strand:+ start:769 stop:921 length:153 start_codon:yes stop_codon:yes gene_type:complete
VKEVKVKFKITPEFIVELFKKAKLEKGEKRQQLMKQAKFLSAHIGSYLGK